jgi:hypothetical protein
VDYLADHGSGRGLLNRILVGVHTSATGAWTAVATSVFFRLSVIFSVAECRVWSRKDAKFGAKQQDFSNRNSFITLDLVSANG